VFIDFSLPDDRKHSMKAKIILPFDNLWNKQRANDEKKRAANNRSPFSKMI